MSCYWQPSGQQIIVLSCFWQSHCFWQSLGQPKMTLKDEKDTFQGTGRANHDRYHIATLLISYYPTLAFRWTMTYIIARLADSDCIVTWLCNTSCMIDRYRCQITWLWRIEANPSIAPASHYATTIVCESHLMTNITSLSCILFTSLKASKW